METTVEAMAEVANLRCTQDKIKDEDVISVASSVTEDQLQEMVGPELELLSQIPHRINALEGELATLVGEDAKAERAHTELCIDMRRKLQKSVEKAKGYFDIKVRVRSTERQMHDACREFDQASSGLAAAKEMVNVTEESIQGKRIEPQYQEVMTHAITTVQKYENMLDNARRRHFDLMQKMQSLQVEMSRAHQENKSAIKKAAPYYNELASYGERAAERRTKRQKLKKKLEQEKWNYAEALEHLRDISEKLHEKRQNRIDREELGERGRGVGAEADSTFTQEHSTTPAPVDVDKTPIIVNTSDNSASSLPMKQSLGCPAEGATSPTVTGVDAPKIEENLDDVDGSSETITDVGHRAMKHLSSPLPGVLAGRELAFGQSLNMGAATSPQRDIDASELKKLVKTMEDSDFNQHKVQNDPDVVARRQAQKQRLSSKDGDTLSVDAMSEKPSLSKRFMALFNRTPSRQNLSALDSKSDTMSVGSASKVKAAASSAPTPTTPVPVPIPPQRTGFLTLDPSMLTQIYAERIHPASRPGSGLSGHRRKEQSTTTVGSAVGVGVKFKVGGDREVLEMDRRFADLRHEDVPKFVCDDADLVDQTTGKNDDMADPNASLLSPRSGLPASSSCLELAQCREDGDEADGVSVGRQTSEVEASLQVDVDGDAGNEGQQSTGMRRKPRRAKRRSVVAKLSPVADVEGTSESDISPGPVPAM